MKTFNDLMPLEILSIEEVAEIKGGTVDNPAGCPGIKAYKIPPK